MKNDIKLNEKGECIHHLKFQCHDVIIPESKLCESCISAQRDYQKTVSEEIIKYIESGKGITKVQSFTNFRYWNLGDIIYKLRKEHTPDYILTEMKVNPVTGSRYALYKKNPKYIK